RRPVAVFLRHLLQQPIGKLHPARRDDDDVGLETGERADERVRRPASLQVAADRDRDPAQRPLRTLQRVEIAEGLGRVLVAAVALMLPAALFGADRSPSAVSISSARRRMLSISSSERSAIARTWRFIDEASYERHFVAAVELADADVDPPDLGSGDVLADEIG